ncbi:hypothetical protein BJ508DRAFT_65109 [Ascobolus immersus RN42]|uniref:RanBD1 domain-containing protein n=1 Tax=Ascobolus immersus RN42 TaxID=1160509 RepID=A0A3N4IQ64_ASCIM|nr:hypothetical protein BJ508DRAFT_65109 [Ascobolus immersus RN42]
MSARPAPLDEEERVENGAKISTATENPGDRMDEERASDGENENVREKLKKTSIANVSEAAGKSESKTETVTESNSAAAAQQVDEEMGSGSENGSTGQDGTQAAGTRSRKRSRDLEDDGQPEKRSEFIGSPMKTERKRTRETEPTGADGTDSSGDAAKSNTSGLPPSSSSADDGHVKKKTRASPESESKKEEAVSTSKSPFSIPPTSGFANTSAKSPFALAGAAAPAGGFASLFGKSKAVAPAPPPPSDTQADASVPAAEKKFSFGTGSQSPFATVGAGATSPFAALAAAKSKSDDSPAFGKTSPFGSGSSLSGGFGASSGTSAFGSGSSLSGGFGGGTSAFGAATTTPAVSSGTMVGGAMAFGGKVAPGASLLGKNSVFGSGGPLQPIGGSSSKSKPFGAASDSEDEDGSDDSDDDKPGKTAKFGEEKNDPTVHVEKVSDKDKFTGEENEITVFQTRGKVFAFDKESKSWKEKGLGNVRLKASVPDLNDIVSTSDAPKRKLRLIARADATYKVLLNVPLSKELAHLYGDKGEEPKGINYTVVTKEDGVTKTYAIKTKQAKELHRQILDALERQS